MLVDSNSEDSKQNQLIQNIETKSDTDDKPVTPKKEIARTSPGQKQINRKKSNCLVSKSAKQAQKL